MHFYSLKRIKIINHGEWSDPEVKYKGKSYNYYDFEDLLFNYYKDNQDIYYKLSFEKFIKENKTLCYDLINENIHYLRRN